jgi:hypothetical protein
LSDWNLFWGLSTQSLLIHCSLMISQYFGLTLIFLEC